MIRATIIGDQLFGRTRIRELLDAENDIEVVAEYADALNAAAEIAAQPPDLLFLDMHMRHGAAFTILEALGPVRTPATIFVAAHDQYALRAFDLDAVDYLLKPFAPARFHLSLERARRHIASRRTRVDQEGSVDRCLTRLAVRDRQHIVLLRVDEVDWIETAGNYVRLHVAAQTYLFRESLAHFEARLDRRRFVRIHRSAIVNVDRVTQLEPAFRREHVVTLRDGTRLTMSAPYRARLQALVGRF